MFVESLVDVAAEKIGNCRHLARRAAVEGLHEQVEIQRVDEQAAGWGRQAVPGRDAGGNAIAAPGASLRLVTEIDLPRLLGREGLDADRRIGRLAGTGLRLVVEEESPGLFQP